MRAGRCFYVLSAIIAIATIHANLLESVVSFNKLEYGCELLSQRGEVNINYNPYILLSNIKEIKDSISSYSKPLTVNKIEKTVKATFHPIGIKLNELSETQHYIIDSFDKLSSVTKQKRAIAKAAIFGLISKTLVQATKKTLMSTVQHALTENLMDNIQSPQMKVNGVNLHKAIIHTLQKQISMGRHEEENKKKLIRNTLSFVKELLQSKGNIQTKVLEAIEAQNEQLSFLNSLKKGQLSQRLALKLNIPRHIEDVKIEKENNTYAVRFKHYKKSTFVDTYEISTSIFDLKGQIVELDLPNSIAIIDNNSYIKNPLKYKKRCGHITDATVFTLNGCLQQIILAKQGLKYNITECAQNIKKSNNDYSIINYKNNLFTIFSKIRQKFTAKCANVPAHGEIKIGLNILSIPFNCSISAEQFKITNSKFSVALATPSFTQVEKDLKQLELTQGDKSNDYIFMHWNEAILASTQALLWIIMMIIVSFITRKLKQRGNNDRVLTPLPELTPPQ